MINVTPVILCGGSGTRLWPLSRTGFPKQFLCLTGNESLFQQAAQRLATLGNADIQVDNPIIVTGEDHRFLAAEQLREAGIELGRALLEPVGRNTAPALTLAALSAVEQGADPVLIVTPSDQTVTDSAAFTAAMQSAVQEAATGAIVILGVIPTHPETGYGYIQTTHTPSLRGKAEAIQLVQRFVEKPDAATAQTYGKGDFRTYAIDCGSPEFSALFQAEGPYDYVFNLSALKHVRSEKDPFTLMRMIQVNVFNTVSTLRMAKAGGAKKYFCVSTDKAANPVNMMGASKRIMEMFLMRESLTQPISMARFANVAFSDGSLLHGFNQRFAKRQPISAPCDVRRYFVTQQESGELCLLSAMLGENRDIFFPKLSEKLHLITFSEIAQKYLRGLPSCCARCG